MKNQETVVGEVIVAFAQFKKGKEYTFVKSDFNAMKKLGKVKLPTKK